MTAGRGDVERAGEGEERRGRRGETEGDESGKVDFRLTEKSMFFLSWLTARGSGTGSVCFMTETDSPERAAEKENSS